MKELPVEQKRGVGHYQRSLVQIQVFSKPDIKAFATTQLLLLDVKTRLVPFSTIITRDVLSQKGKDELENAETASRIKHEAVLLTINEIGQRLTRGIGHKPRKFWQRVNKAEIKKTKNNEVERSGNL